MIDDGEGASKGRLAFSRSFWKEHDRGYGFAQGGAPGAAPPRAFRQPSRIGLRVVVAGCVTVFAHFRKLSIFRLANVEFFYDFKYYEYSFFGNVELSFLFVSLDFSDLWILK